MAHIDLC